jgi:site-specific DNA recombinase
MLPHAHKNAVAAIRVSTTKQGTDGDSPEAQREQIERFAASRGITVKQYFVFLESASKEQQPMQQAVDYCKDPKNNVQLFIVKSIDRFTRGGSHSYDEMKMQLDACKVRLVDIYGIISGEEVNTLEHLGFEYRWSKYSPSKKTEILEAERAKDELRDIMSRMIGAEIRYTQMGYLMRQPPYGLVSEKIETKHGKRCVLKPHPTESKYMRMIFEMRAKGTMHDSEIVAKVNELGFRTRVRYKRDKHDRTKVIAKTGGKPLTVKTMQKLIAKPIYAGINVEKWTDGKPLRCAFKGLVSIELWNRAVKGKKCIVESQDGEVQILTKRPPEHLVNKGMRNPDFPYRKFVLCSVCERPMLGSASRGKSGKRYPAYHCSNHGHYYRIPKQELEDTVQSFISNLTVSHDRIDAVMEAITTEWNMRNQSFLQEVQGIDDRIAELQGDAQKAVVKIRVLDSPTAIKFMEEDLVRIEQQIKELEAQKAKKEAEKPADAHKILDKVRYFLEHLDELLAKQIDPVKKAQLFGALFDRLPKYEDIKPGTPKTPLFTGVSPVFQLLKDENSLMVIPRGIEPLLPG